jgi:hypothetical protein
MLHTISDGLWAASHQLNLPGGFPFPVRMTVVRLADGSLVLLSPVPLDDALAAELAALGPVGFLVAPNLLHHLYLGAAARRYPQAQVLVAPGLPEKVGTLPPHALLDERVPAAWQGQLQVLSMQGQPKLNEQALLHLPSRSLILTDLVFHILHPASWRTDLLLWMVGCRGRLAQSRLVRGLTTDKPAAEASAARLLDLDFDRLVPAHGEIVEREAKAALARALASVLASRPALAVG